MSQTEAPLEAGAVVAERYRVLSLLGEGGMGSVYLVEHEHLHKRFALKVLRREMCESPEIVARFEREAVAAANIGHPHVAEATDFGRLSDGSFFLVLEFVEGKSLRDALESGPLAQARAVSIARQIASALARAHELQIVHRDLKPENVILATKGDVADFVKVLDFGIAKVPIVGGAAGLTQVGQVFGTPEYMAPEQAAGDTVDARADLYALGIMMFEMLTGNRPFEADDVTALLLRHMSAEVPPMSVPVAPELEALVRKLLEKKPGDRVASAAELERLLGAFTVSPAPPPVSVRVNKEAIAATSLSLRGITTRDWLGDPRVAAIRSRVIQLANERRGLVIGGALGAVVLVLVIFAVGVSMARSHTVTTITDAGIVEHIDDDDLAEAQTKGLAGLEPLAKKHPRDPQVQKALFGAYLAKGRTKDALATARSLLEIDPSAANGATLATAIEDAAASDAIDGTPEAALALLEGPMGARGVDILYDLSTRPLPAPKKALFAASLAKPEVRSHASRAMGALLDLGDAKACPDKRAAVERLRDDGDARALPLLKPLASRGGCGLFGTRDCYKCLRKDDVVGAAMAAIEARDR